MDAIVVGIGTALADDPLLTARVEGVARQPRRVVFDAEARLPLESQLVQSARQTPVILICSRAASRTRVQSLESCGVEVITEIGEYLREGGGNRAGRWQNWRGGPE